MPAKALPPLLLFALTAPVLSGCQRGIQIEIVGAPSAPDFVISGQEDLFFQRAHPALDDLEVVEAASSIPVWSIDRDPSCSPSPRFHYGAAPAGWRQIAPPKPLREGIVYVMHTGGCGFFGGVTFKILNGRIVSRPGSGDDPIREVRALG